MSLIEVNERLNSFGFSPNFSMKEFHKYYDKAIEMLKEKTVDEKTCQIIFSIWGVDINNIPEDYLRKLEEKTEEEKIKIFLENTEDEKFKLCMKEFNEL